MAIRLLYTRPLKPLPKLPLDWEPLLRFHLPLRRQAPPTYSLEFQKLSEAKLKISTLCDVPQAYKSLTAKFEEVLPNRGNKVAKVMSN